MKKASLILFLLMMGFSVRSFSQTTTPADFYVGKWEIAVTGSPRGDVTFLTDLVRKEGKITGTLVDASDPNEKRPITKVDESTSKLVIYFESSQAGEISIDLTKVDDDHLKGSLTSYDAKAKRLK